jgi:hypothetical protein
MALIILKKIKTLAKTFPRKEGIEKGIERFFKYLFSTYLYK